jgi:predicted DNA-binding transcriptional regulator AlpA
VVSENRIEGQSMNSEQNGTPKLLLTAPEAAKALAISEKTLWSLSCPRGSIPIVRVGERGVRYSVTALDSWIAGHSPRSHPTDEQAHPGVSSWLQKMLARQRTEASE